MWEHISQVLQQRHSLRFVFIEEHHHHHQFACRSRANHQCAKESLLIAQVEECQSLLLCISAYFVAYLVRNVVLQPTFVDVQHLVKHARNMKSHAIQLLWFMLFLHIFHCQPFAVRECIFQFVAIEIRLFRTQNRCNFRQFHMPKASQVVNHLFLFISYLLIVRQNLPFTSTASAIMFAHSLAAFFAIRVKFNYTTFHVIFFLFHNLQIHHISRHCILCEDNHIIHLSQSLTLSRNISYRNFIKNR